FYSPGWVCPVGWTTATVVGHNMTNSAVPTEVLGRLLDSETAAFCCPNGFKFSFATIIGFDFKRPNLCMSTMVAGDFLYKTCGASGSTARIKSVGRTESLISTWTAVKTEFVNDGADRTMTYWSTYTVTTTYEQLPLQQAITAAPAVQLV
ncbi:hypothetical protein BT67DRAFT_358370, partial [Trichocladium antarcticum]